MSDVHPARVVLGVSGGIAAYKAVSLLRLLTEAGHDVTVIPTASALQFVGRATWEALSHHRAVADVWTDALDVAHVALGRGAQLVIVAPATADLLGKAANGLADDLLTATLLTARCPVLVAPAMHTEMWTHAAVVDNVARLRERGVVVIDPADGRLTGTDSGAGRLPEPAQIAELAAVLLSRDDALVRNLIGRRVVVTAGGTREPLDPVRYLGNNSSGRQGFALALVAAARGAQVTLITANTELSAPPGVRVVDVHTALEMQAATRAAAVDADVVVMAAAVADFRPTSFADHKIKKGPAQPSSVELTRNPDVLAGLVADRGIRTRPVLVGFAAETGDSQGNVLAHARVKLAAKNCDLLVVNDVGDGRGFGRADNQVSILGRDGTQIDVPSAPKAVIAATVWDTVVALMKSDRAG